MLAAARTLSDILSVLASLGRNGKGFGQEHRASWQEQAAATARHQQSKPVNSRFMVELG